MNDNKNTAIIGITGIVVITVAALITEALKSTCS